MTLLISNQEYSFLRSRAFDLIIFNDELFLQDFNGIQLLGCFGLCKHDFAKITFAKDG
jgi:hypothetical protein